MLAPEKRRIAGGRQEGGRESRTGSEEGDKVKKGEERKGRTEGRRWG